MKFHVSLNALHTRINLIAVCVCLVHTHTQTAIMLQANPTIPGSNTRDDATYSERECACFSLLLGWRLNRAYTIMYALSVTFANLLAISARASITCVYQSSLCALVCNDQNSIRRTPRAHNTCKYIVEFLRLHL
jgi:hypothetical protein